jgi:hypothetical protein
MFTAFTSSSSIPSAAALTTCWKLDAGQATRLQPRQAGVFRVAQGRVWVTISGTVDLLGDHVLQAGDSLPLQAGQRLVLEPLASDAPVFFSWEPVAEVVWDGRREARSAGAQWRGGVVQPSRELAQALHSAAAAAGRLVLGLVGLGDYLVVGRGRSV